MEEQIRKRGAVCMSDKTNDGAVELGRMWDSTVHHGDSIE
jgi:hypothetical protein